MMWQILSLCLLAVGSPATPSAPGLLDWVAAVVDGEALTHSEVMMEARVALAWRVGPTAVREPFEPEILESMLDYVINQRLVHSQVRRSGRDEVDPALLERRLQQFRERFLSSQAYTRFLTAANLNENVIRGILSRDLSNDLYLKARFRLKGDGKTLSVREQEELSEWLAELRRKFRIRRLGPDGTLTLQ